MALACGLVVFDAGSSQAQDWPQWRGPNRDGKATGFTAPRSWPKELTQKWKVTVGVGCSTPAVVGDRVYVFSRVENQEILRCLEAGTGKEVWQDKYEAPGVSGPDSGHSGPRSSPTVSGGKLVGLGVAGTLSCWDAATGKVLWRKEDFPGAWPRFHTASSPIVVDGLCISQLGKESEGAIVAYDLSTGDQKWKWAGEGPGYSSPVLFPAGDVKLVVALTAKSIVGLAAKDGKLLWQAPFAPQGMSYNAATPIVDGQTIIYCGQGRGAKAVRLEPKGDTCVATELWANPDNAVQFNTPVLKNGLLYGISARDALFCLNEQNGQTAWSAPSGGKRGFGSLVDAGSVLLALTPSAQLLVLEPNDKEFRQVTSYKVADTETYASPVPASRGLYIKDKETLTLWAFAE